MNRMLVLVGTVLLITGLVKPVPASQRSQLPRGGATSSSQAAQCQCVPPPWMPDPPCVKECTGLLLRGGSDAMLIKTLKPSLQLQQLMTGMRSDGVITSAELDAFLASARGKEFLTSVQKASPSDLKSLVSEARLKTRISAP